MNRKFVSGDLPEGLIQVKAASDHHIWYLTCTYCFSMNIISPPILKSSMRSWNWPWTSPHTVTGQLTACWKNTNSSNVLWCHHRLEILLVNWLSITCTLLSFDKISLAFSQSTFTWRQLIDEFVSKRITSYVVDLISWELFAFHQLHKMHVLYHDNIFEKAFYRWYCSWSITFIAYHCQLFFDKAHSSCLNTVTTKMVK